MKDLKLLIVSGLSGSGKSHALKCLEDLGFFCVDNLPPALLPVFVDLCIQSKGKIRKVAVGIDIREGAFLEDLWSVSDQIKNQGISYELLFFEAKPEVLVRRFSETRRPHPLAKDRPVDEGIQLETERLADLRKSAIRIIDTSEYTIHQLKAVLTQYYMDPGVEGKTGISIISFGYKYGVPMEADLVFDVRFLPNPHFVPELRPLSGRDPDVRNYVFNGSEAGVFQDRVKEFIHFLFPYYEKEGRPFLTVAIGCTGGRHRSVALSCSIQEDLEKNDFKTVLRHRDVDRDQN